ncbi:MAG TPA: AAA family ATPase, partial [Candidatus Xenobia bacterium]
MIRGMVLGKFMPPHAGHQYLVHFARHYCDDLTVVVGTLPSEPIPGSLRYQWMCELFPFARVLHLSDDLPQEPSQHPCFWNVWEAALRRILPSPVELVFASEPYGETLAQVLGARFIPVDPERSAMPVSGTAIREDPLRHWSYLPDPVRPYFVKRVCVFGAESTGKSTLAERLARQFETVVVPEYARGYLTRRGGQVTAGDIAPIARAQAASEDALARRACRLLVCDTDVLSTVVWSEALFGSCDDAIRRMAAERRYHLYLVPEADVPWVSDPVRYLPNDREAFFARCLRHLEGRPYRRLRG